MPKATIKSIFLPARGKNNGLFLCLEHTSGKMAVNLHLSKMCLALVPAARSLIHIKETQQTCNT